jgi:hypothetical protein
MRISSSLLGQNLSPAPHFIADIFNFTRFLSILLRGLVPLTPTEDAAVHDRSGPRGVNGLQHWGCSRPASNKTIGSDRHFLPHGCHNSVQIHMYSASSIPLAVRCDGTA